MKFCFRDAGLSNEQFVLAFDDVRGNYLATTPEPNKNAKRDGQRRADRIGRGKTTPQAQRLQISSSTSLNETTMPKSKNQQDPPAAANNGSAPTARQESHESSATGPIGAAIELRTSLRTALTDVNTLITSLRRQNRQQKLVATTLQSLKELDKIAG